MSKAPEVEYLKNYLSFDNFIQAEMTFESMGDCLEDYEGRRFFVGMGIELKKKSTIKFNPIFLVKKKSTWSLLIKIITTWIRA